MQSAEILFYVLICGIGIGVLFVLQKRYNLSFPTSFHVKIIVLNPGCNIHKDIKIKSLPHTETIEVNEEEKEYNIKLEELWKVKVRLIKRPLHFLMGVKGKYLCIFRSSEEGNAIKNIESKATPILIRKVKKARVLKMALNEVFSKGMGGMGKFIFIFGGTLLIVYLAYTYGLID